MGMWLVQISLMYGVAIGINVEIYSKKTFVVEFYLVFLHIRLGFADFAQGVCVFGHHITMEGLRSWLRKLKEIPTNS